MAYKVTFNTYGIKADGKTGNVIQSTEVIYTDKDTPFHKTIINEDLQDRERVCEIVLVELIKGKTLN
jgi:hypothetical protein